MEIDYEIEIPGWRYNELVQLEGRIKYLIKELANDKKVLDKKDILSIIGTPEAMNYVSHIFKDKKDISFNELLVNRWEELANEKN